MNSLATSSVLPPDLVWTPGGSEVSACVRQGDELVIRLAVAAARGTPAEASAPSDLHVLPVEVRCQGVQDWPAWPDLPGTIRDGAVEQCGRLRRAVPLPGRIEADGRGTLILQFDWRQGGTWTVHCRSVAVLLLPESRVMESWAC